MSEPQRHAASSACPDDDHHLPIPRFMTLGVTRWAVAARLALALGAVPPEWLGGVRSPSLACVVADPTYSFRHVREASAIRRLLLPTVAAATGGGGRFNLAYQLRGAIHLPPLLLAVLEGLLSSFPPRHQQLILGLFLLFIDFLVALLLENVGRRLLFDSKRKKLHTAGDWEESLECRMPQAIQAPLKHIVFGPTQEAAKDEAGNVTAGNPGAKTTTPKQSEHENQRRPLVPLHTIPSLVAVLYFASPATVLAGGLYECFRNLPLLFLLGSIDVALSSPSRADPGSSLGGGPLPGAMLSSSLLALAAYMDVHCTLFVIPVSLLFLRDSGRKELQLLVASFVFYFIFLHFLSFLLIGADLYPSVVASTHFHSFWISGIEPSLSVLWYFGMELFGRFHLYFAILLGGIPYILVAPLAIRLWRYPEVLVRSPTFAAR
jgi:hypothetical protein